MWKLVKSLRDRKQEVEIKSSNDARISSERYNIEFLMGQFYNPQFS